jgi:ornithine cyclodeaminase
VRNNRGPVYSLSDIERVVDRASILNAIDEAICLHAAGKVCSPDPGVLIFNQPPGDCHIKYGFINGGPSFVIKVAVGFYGNPDLGLSTNNGLVLVFDSQTGKTKAILLDEGWLTSWRTAAAGALAARAGAPNRITGLGIVGTGHQAELQAQWASETLGIRHIRIWGRNQDHARALAERLARSGLDVVPEASIEGLFEACNVVITCTPAASPIVPSKVVQSGTHIVAVGADSPGKQELDAEILGRAAAVATDDHRQCLAHGEFHYAVAAGLRTESSDVALGDILMGRRKLRSHAKDITVVDLTGLPAQDVAIAEYAVQRLQARKE